MAKKTEENALAVTTGIIDNNSLSLSKPDFLQGQEATGTELLRQYVVPPRLKIVQPLSKAPLKDLFAPGDLVALPGMQLIDTMLVNGKRQQKSPGILFTPIFFWPEWITANPRELADLPMIRDRSLDPESPIAIKSRNQSTRREKCPDNVQYEMNHMEILNFIIVINSSSPIGSEPILLSFAKAEHRQGTTLNGLIKMRKAPIFGCQFVGIMSERSNAKGQWFGMDCTNPPEELASPWVANQEMFNEFGRAHAEFKKAYDDRLLQADYDEPAEDSSASEM